MSRGKASGYVLKATDAPIIFGMNARGDRDHDIAAWFGVNQGRVAEVKEGKFGAPAAAPVSSLPPRGAPGVKGRRLYAKVERALSALDKSDSVKAKALLEEALAVYATDEA